MISKVEKEQEYEALNKPPRNSKKTRKRLSRRQKNMFFIIILMLPAIALLSVTIVTPLIQAISMSFQDYSLLNPEHKWNNFANYKEIFVSSDFYNSVKITFIYVFAAVVLEFIFGMIIALVLQSNIKFRGFFRSIILIPWVIPTIVAALIFMWIYQPDYGVLNYIFMKIHVIEDKVNWLTSFDFALVALLVVAVWRQVPLMTLFLLAGMQNISQDIYEAAKIDGAGWFPTLFKITIPSLRPVISTVCLMLIVQNFQMFTLFYTLTGGGPVNTTESLTILTYKTAFEHYDFGRGSAMGVILMVVLLLFSFVFTKYIGRKND